MKEIAVFGGTFDPPTKAHEGIMAACLARDDIDELWVMPSGKRPDKPDMRSDAERLEMLQLVRETTFQGDERLIVTDFEQRLPQPTRTCRTVKALETAQPDDNFWYVFGADAYHDMPAWERGQELRRGIGMLIIEREGYELPAENDRIKHLQPEAVDPAMSSTRLREACGEAVDRSEVTDLSRYISSGVAQFIVDRQLYGYAGTGVVG